MPRAAKPTTTAKSTKSSRAPRPAATVQFVNEDNDDLDVNEGIQDEVEDIEEQEQSEEDADDLMNMLRTMQNIQKVKAKKASTSSSAFTKKQAHLFEVAREAGEKAVRDGSAYFEQAKASVIDWKNQDDPYNRHLKDLQSLLLANHQAVQSVLAVYPSLLDDLALKRAEHSDAASAMVRVTYPLSRAKSRRRLQKNFKTRVEQNLENEKVATDATALIAHYKALLIAA